MPVVSDTGPLIAFAKADCLAILKRMFGQIHIPPAVYRELMAKSGPEAERLDYALFDFIITTAAPSIPAEVEEATSRLGPGEKQAIALAYEQGALLLMDDQQGRSAARRLGVRVTGVVGVLIGAKEAGLLPSVREILDTMRIQGCWLSDAVLEAAARQAGETGR
ncbi:MAG: DUF3368 domain-containing protein [Anaerolineae bacterium]